MGDSKRVTIMTEENAPSKKDQSSMDDPTMIKSILKSSLGLDRNTMKADAQLSTAEQRRYVVGDCHCVT